MLNETFIPKILALENDTVPNVKFNIAKFLDVCAARVNDAN